MSLSTGSGKLAFSFKSLRAQWELTQNDWKDRVRDDFESHVWAELEMELMATLNAINTLSQVLNKAEQECE
jgi:hypothetical protein